MCVRADNYTNLWRVRPAKNHQTVETVSSHSLCQLAHALFVCFALSRITLGGAEGTQSNMLEYLLWVTTVINNPAIL